VRDVELVVVGGGPAGCAAAVTAAALGVETLLVDENPLDAASLQRNVPNWYGSRLPAGGATSQRVYRWLAARPALHDAAAAGAEVLTQHTVWGIFPGRVLGLSDGARTRLVRARAVILATGATDLHLAFLGWTLAGVLGGGGALQLFDLYGYLPARRMLILGSGNVALAVAERALAAGIAIAGMVEIGDAPQGDAGGLAALRAAGVPLYTGHTVRAARGGAEVEAVVLTRAGHGPDGPDRVIAADTLCVAIGRQPAIDLAYLAGCALTHDPSRGGFLPRHDAHLRTSVEGVLVAGDAAGTADHGARDPDRAARSGRVAAITAAEMVGRLDAAAAARLRREAGPVAPGNSEDRLDGAEGVFATPWHRAADALATDDLIVCRCEEVTRGAVLAALALVDGDPNEVKRVSRAGMGLCQGRGCRPILAGILAARTGRAYAALPPASWRPPVRAVSLAALATEEERALPRVPAVAALEERLARDVAAGRLGPMALSRFRTRAEELAFACGERGADGPEAERLAAELERQLRAVATIDEAGERAQR
jgi:thioredoxin reductase